MTKGMPNVSVDLAIPEDPALGTRYETETAYRLRARAALEMMKRMERERHGQMRTVRLDSRTVVSATCGRMEEIIKDNECRRSGTIKSEGQ